MPQTFSLKHPSRRINIISTLITDADGKVIQEEGILLRTTRSYAGKLISQGTHTYTSKSKLKSFLVKNAKLYRNERFFEGLGIDLNKLGDKSKDLAKDEKKRLMYSKREITSLEMHKKSFLTQGPTGKVYLALYRNTEYIPMISKKEIDPTTGKQKSFNMESQHHQFYIVKFPG